ncbi:hypothetical protein FA15DRAFT_662565 [Coprinopsis marcescibilis]|uniref:Uncharacterized protein n=1 Tax=Coprinopsis marcescibilis TaxID=230819 RepID=A0A5C3LFA5_COPMA|nr:hypothetical protein FA15DRAFT_662565 [Coprinopsis marcescibilis]
MDVTAPDTSLNHQQLRSAAFWDLHRSVVENAEGLVHRMREHEYQWLNRSPGERGRMRDHHIIPPSSKSCPSFSDEYEEEDIQIYSGESCHTSPSSELTSGRDNMTSATLNTFARHSLQTNDVESANSIHSNPSFRFPHSQFLTSPNRFDVDTTANFDISSEQALEAITLAFANGAGSINNYPSLHRLSSSNDPGTCGDAGDLWQ